MNDKEFVLDLLGKFGKEVAESTRSLVCRETDSHTYIKESMDQLCRYGTSLLEWKEKKNEHDRDSTTDR